MTLNRLTGLYPIASEFSTTSRADRAAVLSVMSAYDLAAAEVETALTCETTMANLLDLNRQLSAHAAETELEGPLTRHTPCRRSVDRFRQRTTRPRTPLCQ